MLTAHMTIRFRSRWSIATGVSQAAGLDMLCVRDKDGLPYVPGRHLKGMLREALREANGFRWTDVTPDDAFGPQQVRSGDPGLAGKVRVWSAHLPQVERVAILKLSEVERAGLFREHHKTAIDEVTGSALPMSLRSEEVIIPLSLTAQIEGPEPELGAVIEALPLIRRLGRGRTRGLGRCIITVERE